MSMDEIDPKLKRWGIALGVLVLALALVDFVVLKGDSVGGGSVSLRADSPPLVLTITRPGEKHLVKIKTRKRSHGESVGQSIAYQLIDPSGVAVVEESELFSRKSRYFSFSPAAPGEYALHVEETKLVGSGRGSGYVSVTVDDHRVLSRLLGF